MPSNLSDSRTARRVGVLAAAVLPGALAGAQLAGLLFFLNPDLPFGASGLARFTAVYGMLLGALSAALLLPFTARRPRLAARLVPWSLTAVFGLAALCHWTHAARLAYYLPPGINDRLLKAGFWLTGFALIAFYTALLHSLNQRSYGLRSRAGFVLMTVASIYVLVERREAFRPRQEPAPLSAAVVAEQRPRLLVVGIDTATLDAILPLAEQGELPFFARLVRVGAHGHLASLSPTWREPLWTTAATGKLPYKHGILGSEAWSVRLPGGPARLQLLPAGIGFARWGLLGGATQRVDASDRSASPVWETLQRLGVATGLVGWPVTDPPPDLSFAFSERFFEAEAASQATPAELAERGLLFRVPSEEVEPEIGDRFGPEPPRVLRIALARDLWRQSLTLFLIDQRPEARALFLMMPGLAAVSRRSFGGFSAAEFEGSHDVAAAASAALLTAYYQHLDGFLAELWARVEEPRLLAVVSAYGVDPPTAWQRLWGDIRGAPAQGGHIDEAPDGVLLLAGAGVRPAARLQEASLVDLVPTLIYGLGFPIARDLDGQVLTGAFDSSFLASRPLAFVPSYETLREVEAPPPAPE